LDRELTYCCAIQNQLMMLVDATAPQTVIAETEIQADTSYFHRFTCSASAFNIITCLVRVEGG